MPFVSAPILFPVVWLTDGTVYRSVVDSNTLNSFNKSSAVAEMGDRLATIDMGRKVGVLCHCYFQGWELGPNRTHCRLDRDLPARQVFILIDPTVWQQYTN